MLKLVRCKEDGEIFQCTKIEEVSSRLLAADAKIWPHKPGRVLPVRVVAVTDALFALRSVGWLQSSIGPRIITPTFAANMVSDRENVFLSLRANDCLAEIPFVTLGHNNPMLREYFEKFNLAHGPRSRRLSQLSCTESGLIETLELYSEPFLRFFSQRGMLTFFGRQLPDFHAPANRTLIVYILLGAPTLAPSRSLY